MAPNEMKLHKMAVSARKLKEEKVARGSVNTRRRKRRRSACARKEEGSIEIDSPEFPRSALSQKSLFATVPAPATDTITTTASEEGEEAVTSIADSPPVHNRMSGPGSVDESANSAAGPEPLPATSTFPHGEEGEVVCYNGSMCGTAMIEELLGDLCAEDVMGSFSVSLNNESSRAPFTQDHPDCDVAPVLPFQSGAPFPLSSTPVVPVRQCTKLSGEAVVTASHVFSNSSTNPRNVALKESTATLPQTRQPINGMAANKETDTARPKQSCCYPAGTFYGLSSEVKRLLADTRGITALYEWQDRCLNSPALCEGRNLVYSLPTSGGKTLVAEILILQQVLLKKKDVVFILPFVSIVQEKVRQLTALADALGFAVEEYASSKGRLPPRQRRRQRVLYVATIEKGNGLVNSLVETGRADSVGLTVVDELHMVGEEGRGAVLEACLAKLMFASPATQVVGMSATLSNLNQLAAFLSAEVFSDDFRPVELREYVKIGGGVFSIEYCSNGRVEFGESRVVSAAAGMKCPASSDVDHLLPLMMEVVPQHACLVFCPTKKNCQNVALLLAQNLPRNQQEFKQEERRALREVLRIEAAGLCPVLQQTIPFGVAYHHSGLSAEERRILEDAYLKGTLCVLACTSTLAAGVNLPAKRVILRSPYIGNQFMSKGHYKQMCGRAGRAGFGQTGESILIVPPQDRQKVVELLSSPLEHCHSGLLGKGGGALAALLLAAVALKLATALPEVMQLMARTLLHVQLPLEELRREVQASLKGLVTKEFLVARAASSDGTTTLSYEVTPLGRAAFKGTLDAALAQQAYRTLARAQQCLVVSSELHLLYIATPPDLVPSCKPNWMAYLEMFARLSEDESKVAEVIGIRESVLSRHATGMGRKMNEETLHVYCQFFLSLLLRSLLQLESSAGVWKVAERFECSRGYLQGLLQSAASFASCLVHFTQELPEFWAVNLLLPTLVKRLMYASSADLVPLLEIPGVKHGRARQLYSAGYRTPQHLAQATANDLVDKVEHLYRDAARKLIREAKKLLAEQLEMLQEEADELRLFLPPP